jgi:SsrA-binding protein
MAGADRGEDAGERLIADNRRARYDYFIEDSVEAGIVLSGTEIRSIRAGRVQLREAYARVEHGECFLFGMHIGPYEGGNRWNHEPTRPRKLLLHRRQIDELWQHARQGGRTLVPLRLYIRRGRAKVQIGLARGKHTYDKREAIAERDRRRDMDRALAPRSVLR